MDDCVLDAWHKTAPYLAAEELAALVAAMRADDMTLTQGVCAVSDVSDSRGERFVDAPAVGACLLCYGAFRRMAMPTVLSLETRFLQIANATDSRSATVAAWWDTIDRAEAIAEFLPLVEAELARRAG